MAKSPSASYPTKRTNPLHQLGGLRPAQQSAGIRFISRFPYIAIDGRQYLWKDILELRRSQLAAYATPATQMLLFESLRDDCRPAEARTASGRYLQPALFDMGA
jgi:hypothetical protein